MQLLKYELFVKVETLTNPMIDLRDEKIMKYYVEKLIKPEFEKGN